MFHTFIIQESVIDARIFPWHPVDGVVESSCVRVEEGTLSHGGAQVSLPDDGGEAAALFNQDHLFN